MGGPTLKGSPQLRSLLGPQNPSCASGERQAKRVWMVVISYYGDWRLVRGNGNARIPVRCLSDMDNRPRTDKEKGGLGDFSPRKC
jgi:hypothetical protein